MDEDRRNAAIYRALDKIIEATLPKPVKAAAKPKFSKPPTKAPVAKTSAPRPQTPKPASSKPKFSKPPTKAPIAKTSLGGSLKTAKPKK